MLEKNKLKEHSFLVYGLGLSGCSVVNFFKKKGITNFSVWDDKQKNLYKNHRVTNLDKTLKEVNYVVLTPGVSLIKNKNLRQYEKKL